MGLIVDTSVFIQWERRGGIVDLSSLDPTDDVLIMPVWRWTWHDAGR
jgi:hypothetical protein